MRSRRRGDGSELVGVRAYRSGDDLRRLDHRASARASRARDDDVLLVREFYAEEAAPVVLVLDRSATMRLFPEGMPWLSKPAAVREIVRLVADSAWEARSAVGCVAAGAGEVASWRPARRARTDEWLAEDACVPAGSLARAFGTLARMPRLGAGTFVFVVSDFLDAPGEQAWWPVLARGWDAVPVVLQDPVWEQSFPAVGGVPLAVAAADGSGGRLVRVSRREAESLRAAHETRLRTILQRLRALTLEPVCVGADDPERIHLAFASWAAMRAGKLR
jgi:uncharacterized protein (DUF58 family)